MCEDNRSTRAEIWVADGESISLKKKGKKYNDARCYLAAGLTNSAENEYENRVIHYYSSFDLRDEQSEVYTDISVFDS